MRKGLVGLAVLASPAVAYWVLSLAFAGPGSCGAVLLEGTLAVSPTNAAALVVVRDDGRVQHVDWPFGYAVGGGPNGEPVLTRLFFQVASPRDYVRSAGGYGYDDTVFKACGVIDVDPAEATPEPQPIGDPTAGP